MNSGKTIFPGGPVPIVLCSESQGDFVLILHDIVLHMHNQMTIVIVAVSCS